MPLKYKTFAFLDCKAEGDGDGSEFSGYAAVFNNVDSYGDVIVPGAFKRTLDDFMLNGQICFNHGEVIGKPLDAKEDQKGLFIRGKISDTAKGRDCKTLIKDKVMRKMSIGYRAVQAKSAVPDDVRKYWQEVGYQPTEQDAFNLIDNKYGLTFLHEIKLYEASPVAFPANTEADITGSKGMLKLSELAQLVKELKEGRKLSTSMRDRLSGHHQSLSAVCKDLGDILTETAPASETEPEPDPDTDGKARAAALTKARNELSLLHLHPVFTRNDR
ncbi:MAG TPA: HK97 family phage prohead protease [Gemmatimonadales bacterium]|nr:HK97 family phage prohead protease [Gemmatimonadales bacterium]